jgi:hypothetical protein
MFKLFGKIPVETNLDQGRKCHIAPKSAATASGGPQYA